MGIFSYYRIKKLWKQMEKIPEVRGYATMAYTRLNRRYLNVFVDTNWLCNLKCIMCHFGSPEHKEHFQREMDGELFNKIAADLFPRAYAVALSCGAEPLMSKNFPAYLEIASRYKVPRVNYVTNGLLLTDEVMKQSIAYGVHEVIFSVDAATKAVYEEIRGGGKI